MLARGWRGTGRPPEDAGWTAPQPRGDYPAEPGWQPAAASVAARSHGTSGPLHRRTGGSPQRPVQRHAGATIGRPCWTTKRQFLFKEEILHLANALDEPGMLDNVEDLLTDVITSPRFDSEVFTLERSLQVMLGAARRDHPRRAADRRAGRVRPGRRGAHRRRGPRAPGRLARPLRPRDRQRAQLPEQPGRHPGPQLLAPRSRTWTTGGSCRAG